ncbi:hypothetical protein BBOV_VI_pgp27 (apicoplast) [Babesia bovis T2Bo]|uniref:Uncharacterized protein n=1 Tax=Babesia bovis TaxID=5865 RepID=A7AXE6_BABBO|nr:hypothetical protein BBOV_VI_pgp27 [Babesia bovis T2Bo]EDO05069.1 hypothetical protein BBOV_V000140 [Babesia bovis T2Bo]|eukprot:YP_002290849.1 hypothetical protein BBOV_V000140 (apicoplast) [Babesia bovis T2Bo]
MIEALYKFNFKNNKVEDIFINVKLFKKIKKNKIRFINISSLIYKKIYKAFKTFRGPLLDYSHCGFNTVQIKTILFHKPNKEYVKIREYLNFNNLTCIFYK